MLIALLPRGGDDPLGKRNLVRVVDALEKAGVDRISVLSGEPEAVFQAARESQADWIWIHYPDLVLPFETVVQALAHCTYPVLKPYSAFCRLTQQESESDTATASDQTLIGKAFGKGSFLIKRELFLALGGLHPDLYLDGDEGFEFATRLRFFFPKIPTVPVRGRWLFRPRSPAEKEARHHSAELRKSLRQEFEDDPDGYLENFPRLNTSRLQSQVLELALAPTSPHPPRTFPTSLPGSLWGLTTYFNPQDYETKRQNFRLFRKRLELPLCVVELAFDGRPFELGPDDAELLIQVRGGDVLWQKEQLLNIGLKKLPSECDKVCWLDADVLFENPDWAVQTARLLEEYVVVQPFSLSVRLRPHETDCSLDGLPLGSAEHEVLHSMAYGVAAKGTDSLSSYLAHGHSGYAWAARRSVMETHGFYRANVLGNADLNIAQAMFGGDKHLKIDRLSPAAADHLKSWANAFYEDVRGSVIHVEGTIFHLWHGYKENRLYSGRLDVLIDHDFDPDEDLTASPEGPLIWSSDKPGLHDWCDRYFALRGEDTI
jgi:hypothetical protein